MNPDAMIKVIKGNEPKRRGSWKWWVDGFPAICGNSSQPLFAACRKLSAAGFKGVIVVLYREGHAEWDARCSLEWGAEHRVVEPKNRSPFVTRHDENSLKSIAGTIPKEKDNAPTSSQG
jgi:hypothetical protein